METARLLGRTSPSKEEAVSVKSIASQRVATRSYNRVQSVSVSKHKQVRAGYVCLDHTVHWHPCQTQGL